MGGSQEQQPYIANHVTILGMPERSAGFTQCD